MKTEPVFKIGIGVAVIQNGMILLSQRKVGRMIGVWSCPGGKLDPNENLAEGGVRELYEETRLKADPKDMMPIGFISDNYGDDFDRIGVYFLLTKFQGTPVNTEPDKAGPWIWHPYSPDLLPRPNWLTPASIQIINALYPFWKK